MYTGTPIIIDHIVYPHWPQPQNQRWGPWKYGDALYIVLAEEFPVTGQSFLRVYMQPYCAPPSTPWVELDAAHHPEVNNNVGSAVYEGGSFIDTAYVHDDITYIRRFDLDTELWETTTISSFSDVVPSLLRMAKSGGAYVFYFAADNGSGFQHAYWRMYGVTGSGSITAPAPSLAASGLVV